MVNIFAPTPRTKPSVLNSTAGYGLLFDAGCGMVYKDAHEGSIEELEAANEVDY